VLLRAAPIIGDPGDLKMFTPDFGESWDFLYTDGESIVSLPVDGQPDPFPSAASPLIIDGFLKAKDKL
jgi:hypothetical protein